MKKLITIALLLISFTSYSQVYTKQPWYGLQVARVQADSVLTIPSGLGTLRQSFNSKQLRYNESDSSLYVWSGFNWLKSGGGGADSAVFATQYQIDTLQQTYDNVFADINGRLSGKVRYADSTTTFATPTQLAAKLNIADTANIRVRLTQGTNVTITGTYPNLTINAANQTTDTTSLSNRINTKLNIVDTANIRARLIAGTNITLSGTYPNITITGSAAGWGLSGNAATFGNYLGNSNNVPLRIRTNGVNRLVLDSASSSGFRIRDYFSSPALYPIGDSTVNSNNFIILNVTSNGNTHFSSTAAGGELILSTGGTQRAGFTNGRGSIALPTLISSTIGAPVASAQLELTSTTRGFLPPRMTNTQRTAITSPAIGLIVYCTDAVEGLYIYKSTGWTLIM